MPKKGYKSDMSVKGLDSLIRELQKYKDDLPNKLRNDLNVRTITNEPSVSFDIDGSFSL